MFCFKSMKARLIAIMVSVSLATSVCLGSIVIYSSVQENERLLQAYREDLEKMPGFSCKIRRNLH